MPKTINIKIENTNYDVIIKENIINELNTYIDKNENVFIISDDNVANHYLDSVLKQFENSNYFIINSGESSKVMETVINIIAKLDEISADRKTLIIALGGGVVGDISGLVAMLYRRGLKYISIPTTTLSQVDSSVGGKVAVNYLNSKNLIGGFYHPSLVLIDINTLKTLDQRNFNAGLIEAVKMGLTSNKYLFDLILNKDVNENLEEIIFEAIKIKASIVKADQCDFGIRNILNFGHTLGHAIEMKYNIIHGEAVLIGMINSLISNDIKNDLLKIAKKFNINTNIKLSSELYDLIVKDKKINKQTINLVNVYEIGSGYLKSYPINFLKELLDE